MADDNSGIVQFKKCSRCGKEKARDQFSPRNDNKSGLASQCKACRVEHGKAYREYSAETVLESKRRYRDANRDKLRASNRIYQKNNLDKTRIRGRRYCERKKKLIAQLTKDQWQWLLEQSGNRCVYCGKHESEVGTLAQEHTIPVIQGGAYTITNIRPACATCNARKGARTPDQAGMTFAIKINALEHMKQTGLFND